MDNPTERIESQSEWFNETWRGGVTPEVLLGHLLMLGREVWRLTTQLGALSTEIRISLIFPLLFLVVTRLHWLTRMLSAGVFVVLVEFARPRIGVVRAPYHGNDVAEASVITAHFLFIFFFGAMLFYRDQIRKWMGHARTRQWWDGCARYIDACGRSPNLILHSRSALWLGKISYSPIPRAFAD